MTITRHIAKAKADLDSLHGHSPGEPAYHGLVMSAIANALVAVADLLSGQERPPIPGLPKGYQLNTQQDTRGARKWGYVLRGPDADASTGASEFTSRYRWETSEAALVAGIQDAQAGARQQASA